MVGFERHVFVCTNQRAPRHPRGCCADRGAELVLDRLKRELAAKGLKGSQRVNASGCLDHCEHGVTIAVYPEAVWYGGVGVEDVAEIVETHLVGGRPVERLRIRERLPKATP